MKAFFGIAAAAILLLPAGCGTAKLFQSYDLPESADVEAAPWPELADTPDAPPVGSPGVPDPAIGIATAADLGEVARAAEERAASLNAPVLDPAELARLPHAAPPRE